MYVLPIAAVAKWRIIYRIAPNIMRSICIKAGSLIVTIIFIILISTNSGGKSYNCWHSTPYRFCENYELKNDKPLFSKINK